MARCRQCGTMIPDESRFCPQCGLAQPQRPGAQEQLPLPFSPWGPPPAWQPAGEGATAHPAPQVGPPLSYRQVGIAVGAILLFLLLVILYGNAGHQAKDRASTGDPLPVLGIMGDAVPVGATIWGAAFTDQVRRVDQQPPKHGQFFAVGIVVGDHGREAINLSRESVGLRDSRTGTRYEPTVAVWGDPEQIRSGDYTTRYTLQPGKLISGLVIFDVPPTLASPHLLIRDLAADSTAFTGEIDLTQERRR